MTLANAYPASSVHVRLAAPADGARLLEWRNDPWIASLGASGRTVTIDEHAIWFAHALQQRDTLLYVVEVDGVQCGTVRFDFVHDSAYVSIFLVREWVGRGIGTIAFTDAAAQAFVAKGMDRICAQVVRSNERSIAFFARLGFEESEPANTGPLVELVLPRPRVPHSRPFVGEEEAAAAAAVVRSRHLVGGSEVEKLEAAWKSFLRHENAVAVGSGVGALRLALYAVGVRHGDEVLLPAYACVALANAVLSLGAAPVYCDVISGSWTIDVGDALRRRTAKTRAVIAVHMFGMPADIDGLLELQVPILEDCAHAVGELGVSLGARATTVAIGSFYATKLLGAGEGGIVSCNRREVADLVRTMRDYSDQAPDAHRLNDKMTDVAAAIANCQCKNVATILLRRAERAARYDQLLQPLVDAGRLTRPLHLQGRVWYRYVIELEPSRKADVMVNLIAQQDISIAQPVWDLRGSTTAAALAVTNHAFDALISLPLYPDITPMQQQIVVEALTVALRD